MNSRRAARALDINERTLKLWIERPEFAPFFSEPARRPGASRDLNDDDVIVANTIRSLRGGTGNNNVNWQAIADQLAGNHRDRQLPASAQTVNAGLSVVAEHERMAQVIEQRDSSAIRVNQLTVELQALRGEINDLHEKNTANVERIVRELTERATRAETELELWRSGRIKPAKG